jgi:tripartite motif-containing protein 71
MRRIVLTLISVILLFPIGFAGAQSFPTEASFENHNDSFTQLRSWEPQDHVLYQQGLADPSTLSPSKEPFDPSFEPSLDESFYQTQPPSAEEQSKPTNSDNYIFRRSWGGEGDMLVFLLDIDVTSDGVLIIPDSGFSRVTMINQADDTVRIIGGYGEEPGEFIYPHAVAVDYDGSFFVGDRDKIQHFTKNGELITSWGTSGTEPGQVQWVSQIAINAQGYLYIIDNTNRIQKFTKDGYFITTWGSEGSGPGQFDGASGLAIDHSGYVYITDCYNHRVQKFDPNGMFILEWGSEGTGENNFKYPEDLVIDYSGNVIIAERAGIVKKFSPSGVFLGYITLEPALQSFTQMTLDEKGNYYVIDGYYDSIIKYNSNGEYLKKWGSSISGTTRIRYPSALTQNVNKQIVISSSTEDNLKFFTPSGSWIRTIGHYGNGKGEFNSPRDLTHDRNGNIYIADWGNSRIQIFDQSGNFIRSFGTEGRIGSIAVDSLGNIYGLDGDSDQVLKFTNSGQLITSWYVPDPYPCINIDYSDNVYVTNTEEIYQYNSNGSFIRSIGQNFLFLPSGIDFDLVGNIYVAERGRDRITVFDSAGNFLYYFGEAGSQEGEFTFLLDIAVADDGDIFALDSGNQRISMFTRSLPPNDSFSGLVQNGSFEKEPTLMEWTYGGDLPVTRTTSTQTHGSYSMLLGEQSAQTEQGIREAWAYSNFFVNPNWSRPVLTFNYRMQVNDIMDYSDFFVAIQDGVGLNHLQTVLRDGFQPCVPAQPPAPGQDLGWRSATIDLSAYKGQHIRLVFSNRNLWTGSWGIWTYLDEVKVWDAGYLPPVAGPYENHMPMIFKYHCDERTKGTEDDEPPLRPITPGLN